MLLTGNIFKTQAQFTSGTTFHILGGTTASINGLILTPTAVAGLTLSNQILNVSSVAIPGSPTNSINRVYEFNTPINFFGKVGIKYLESELNGNVEDNLKLAYYNDEELYVTTGPTSGTGEIDVNQNLVSHSFPLILTKDLLKITAVEAGSELPVTLIEFAAKRSEQEAFLSWSTSMETNSDYFEIQRSSNGKQWSALAQIESNGESKTLKTYTYTDVTPLHGQNLYRLKMVDNDGSYTFSQMKSLSFNLNLASVYPNPVVDKLNIKADDWAKVKNIEVYNATGQIQQLNKLSQSPDSQIREYEFREMPSGVYLIKTVRKDGTEQTVKVLKK